MDCSPDYLLNIKKMAVTEKDNEYQVNLKLELIKYGILDVNLVFNDLEIDHTFNKNDGGIEDQIAKYIMPDLAKMFATIPQYTEHAIESFLEYMIFVPSDKAEKLVNQLKLQDKIKNNTKISVTRIPISSMDDLNAVGLLSHSTSHYRYT